MRSQASPTGSTSRTMRGLSMSSFSAAALGRSTMSAAETSAAISRSFDAFAPFLIVCAPSVVHTKSSSPSLRTRPGDDLRYAIDATKLERELKIRAQVPQCGKAGKAHNSDCPEPFP